MDTFTTIFRFLNSGNAVITLCILAAIIIVLAVPWRVPWKCTKCELRFDSEEEAKGHQMIHAEHKAAPDL